MRTPIIHFASLLVVGVLPLGIPTMGSSQPILQRGFKQGIHSHLLKEMPYRSLDEMRMQKGHQAIPSPFRRVVSSQSEIYVIDTAFVRTVGDGTNYFGDTTRHLYSFNANGKRTCDLTQKLTGDLWVDTFRGTDSYDANENMLTELNERWSNGQWVNSSRYTWTYDANGNMLIEMYEGWSNGQWVNSWRYTWTYDANGNMLTALGEEWLNSQWENSLRYTWTHDANGNMLIELHEGWSNGQWVDSWRYTWTYDANGNRLTALSEEWSNSQWVNSSRYTWTYDANENMLIELNERGLNGQCVIDRYTYTYDAHGNVTSFWHYDWLNSAWTPTDGFQGSCIGFSASDGAGNVYIFGSAYNVTLSWKLVVTGVSGEGNYVSEVYTLSQNYPNPFNPSTTIRYELPKSSEVTLSVYDLLGREVAVLVKEKKDAGIHDVKFDATGLSSGVYFYRMQAGDYVATKTLLLIW